MTVTSQPVHLPESRLPEADQVLARAFFDDPMTVFVIPDETQRRAVLPTFMGVGVRLVYRYGEVYTTEGGVEGVAVWTPPNAPEFTQEHFAEAGGAQSERLLGEESMRRFDLVMATWGPLHNRDMPDPHWYLMILGVDPPRQGQGLGGSLIAPVLARADAEGMPCYLETAKARNVPFYQRHGFEVLVEDTMPEAGFHYWTMRRPPRR